MTLPASPNSISLGQVNTELGRSATATIDMNDSAVRSLFGKPGSGNTISMDDGRGKSSRTFSLAEVNGASFFGPNAEGLLPNDAQMSFYPNGSYEYFDQINVNFYLWANPIADGLGNNYWIKFTRTSTSGSNGASTATSGWQQLNAYKYISVRKNTGGTLTYTAVYTIQIASDSAGTNIIATATNVSFQVSR